MRTLFLLTLASLLFGSCSLNPFDEAQVPNISVRQEGGKMVVEWKPQGAWHVRLLKGVVDPKDPKNTRPPSQGVVWGIAEEERPVRSPVVIGEGQPGTDVSPEPPELEPGATYTVYVLRHDPKGSGDGFTNTRNVYEAVKVVRWGK